MTHSHLPQTQRPVHSVGQMLPHYNVSQTLRGHEKLPRSEIAIMEGRVDREWYIFRAHSWISDPSRGHSVFTGPAFAQSGACADMECVHGRLSGDPCPQPPTRITKWDAKGRGQTTLVRLWTSPYPCGCWGEARVRWVDGRPEGTPDLLTQLAPGHVSHRSVTDPVGRPRPHDRGAENGRKPAGGRNRSRRDPTGLGAAASD